MFQWAKSYFLRYFYSDVDLGIALGLDDSFKFSCADWAFLVEDVDETVVILEMETCPYSKVILGNANLNK